MVNRRFPTYAYLSVPTGVPDRPKSNSSLGMYIAIGRTTKTDWAAIVPHMIPGSPIERARRYLVTSAPTPNNSAHGTWTLRALAPLRNITTAPHTVDMTAHIPSPESRRNEGALPKPTQRRMMPPPQRTRGTDTGKATRRDSTTERASGLLPQATSPRAIASP